MNAVQCDYCGKFEANPDKRIYSMDYRLPTGWWSVGAQQLDTDRESRIASGLGGDFCSLGCIGHFYAREASK